MESGETGRGGFVVRQKTGSMGSSGVGRERRRRTLGGYQTLFKTFHISIVVPRISPPC